MNSLQESFEAIAFQKDLTFPKTLTGLFEEACTVEHLPDMSPVLQKIAELTRDVVNVTISVEVYDSTKVRGSPYYASVIMPDFNAFSPLNQKAIKRLENFDFANMTCEDLITGTIDRKNGKLGGWFSSIGLNIRFSSEFFNGNFTGAELAAIYTHELGHFYTFCEFMGETLSTNVIVAEVVGRMDSQASVDKRFELVKAALKISGQNPNVPKDIGTEEVMALLIKGQTTRMQGRAGTRWYDVRLAEALADQFTARWMLGAPLATALAKLERQKMFFQEAGYEPVWMGVFSNLLNVAFLPFGLVKVGVNALLLGSARSLMSSFVFSLGFTCLSFGFGNKAYNTTKQRIRQQRRELVGLLKDRALTKTEVVDALADIKLIDDELDSTHNLSDVLGVFTNYLLRLFTGQRNEVDREIEKEELVNNRLYELAASIKG